MIREKPKNIRATLGKLLKYIGKNKYSVILIIVTTIITTLLNLLGLRSRARRLTRLP